MVVGEEVEAERPKVLMSFGWRMPRWLARDNWERSRVRQSRRTQFET